MSIATDIEVNWNGTVDNANKIGLSKPLNQLPVTVFDDAEFCLGYQNKALKLTKESESYPHSTDAGADNVPFYLLNNVGYSKNSANEPDGVYYRTILIAVPNGFTWGWDSNLRSNNSQIRIVTKLDLQKNKLYFTTNETQKNALTTSDVYLVNESIENTTATGNFVIGADTYHIRCADIYLTENGYYIKFQTYIDNMYDNFNPTYGEGIAANFNYNANSSKMYSVAPVMFANVGWVIAISGSGNPNTYYIQMWNDTELDIAPDADNADIKFFAGYRLVSPYYWRVGINYSVEYALWIAASYGLLFEWNGTPYKPVIEYGALKGYTDDMSTPSDIDNWTDVTGHNISPTPPVPPPSEDDSYADMGIGVGTGVGGYTTFAIMTKNDLVDLLADFNANLEDGMSVVNNFICLYKLGPLASSLCSTRVGNIIMSANATTNFVSIRADYNIVTSQENVITLGSYNVPRMTNTFYDFAPYSTYELFIPCCGWVPLPDTVAGRQITVYLIIDLSSCTCKGICRISGTTVAEASGVLGVSVPFFSTDSGIKRAADLMAVTQVISGIAQGAVGAGAGAGALVVSGSANALQGLEQLYINGNTNYTAIKGGNGDITAVGNGEYCTIKIAHPKVDEVVNNSKFGHSVGYLCNTVGKIKSFKGLTICANPHVNGIDCTESEKEEIKRLLEEGIIVN